MIPRKYNIQSFVVDQNLMYLIQKASGHSTENILSYFHRMTTGIMDTYLIKKKIPQYFNKEMLWHYEGLDHVPYKISIRSGHTINETINLWVKVNFPKSVSNVDMTMAMNTLIETSIGLDGAVSMPPFPKPRTRVPAGFKKLIHD